jgi:hypothetical protein
MALPPWKINGNPFIRVQVIGSVLLQVAAGDQMDWLPGCAYP